LDNVTRSGADRGGSPLSGSALPPVVLVVDAHEDTLEMYDALLSASGYWVACASSGGEALRSARRTQPGAIVIDVDRPGSIDVAQLVPAIRDSSLLRDVPILAITARTAHDSVSILELRPSAILRKPVAPEMLVTCVETAMG
jgi:CheY-like chemotaxis protein